MFLWEAVVSLQCHVLLVFCVFEVSAWLSTGLISRFPLSALCPQVSHAGVFPASKLLQCDLILKQTQKLKKKKPYTFTQADIVYTFYLLILHTYTFFLWEEYENIQTNLFLAQPKRKDRLWIFFSILVCFTLTHIYNLLNQDTNKATYSDSMRFSCLSKVSRDPPGRSF